MMKASKILSICVAVMGLVHIIATFTPLIDGKLQALEEQARSPFVYFSLMCGAFLLVGGFLGFLFSDKVPDHAFLKKPCLVLLASLSVDGILAVCYMPHNPFAWVIFALTLGLAISGFLGSRKDAKN